MSATDEHANHDVADLVTWHRRLGGVGRRVCLTCDQVLEPLVVCGQRKWDYKDCLQLVRTDLGHTSCIRHDNGHAVPDQKVINCRVCNRPWPVTTLKREYCSDACKMKAYARRVKRQSEADGDRGWTWSPQLSQILERHGPNQVSVQPAAIDWTPSVGDRVRVKDTGRLGTVDRLKGSRSLRIRVVLDRPAHIVSHSVRPLRAWFGAEDLEPAT